MPQTKEVSRRFEALLRQIERQLVAVTSAAVEQGRKVASEDALDTADQAVQSYQKEMLFTQSTTGARQLNMVRDALARISEGTYGDCMSCGLAVGLKRLEALPWTRYCIDCQQMLEKGVISGPIQAA